MKQLDDRWTQAKCLYFCDEGLVNPAATTHKFAVFDGRSNTLIGYVKWYSNWRQFVFFPVNALLMPAMMLDLIEFCTAQNEAQRAKRKPPRDLKRMPLRNK